MARSMWLYYVYMYMYTIGADELEMSRLSGRSPVLMSQHLCKSLTVPSAFVLTLSVSFIARTKRCSSFAPIVMPHFISLRLNSYFNILISLKQFSRATLASCYSNQV